jgi:hypothetical protein
MRKKREARKFRARFVKLGESLGIHPPHGDAADVDAQYRALSEVVSVLVNSHVLRNGALVVAKSTAASQRCVRSLHNAREGVLGPHDDILGELCYRLLGFIREEPRHRWTYVTAVKGGDFAKLIDKVLSKSMQERIAEHVKDGQPTERLQTCISQWLDFLQGEPSERPRWCWEREHQPDASGKVLWVTNAYSWQSELLDQIARARSDVRLVGISFSKTFRGDQADAPFVSALKNGATLKFLIFDWISGDLERTAADLRLDPQLLLRYCQKTSRVIRTIKEKSAALSAEHRVEVRLFTQDPGLRCYLLDQNDLHNGRLYFFLRRPGGALEGPGFVANSSERGLVDFYTSVVDSTWDASVTWEHWWQTHYLPWRETVRSEDLFGGEDDDD